MSLNVDWRNASESMQKRIEDNSNIAYNIGMILMLVGVSSVTPKSLKTLKKRLLIEHKLFNTVGAETIQRIDDYLGIYANVSNYTDAQYLRNVNKRLDYM